MISFENIEGFEWDEGNIEKNWQRHQILNTEAEQVFFNEPIILEDEKHSTSIEQRYHALGKTDNGKYLLIVFTVRKKSIRIISARTMSYKERKMYDEKTKKDSEI
ncbi:MAG: BrnT family toxin [Ignavibacteria bacterium]|nr:BrnT family toxin [Ignavibacteria bacterium]